MIITTVQKQKQSQTLRCRGFLLLLPFQLDAFQPSFNVVLEKLSRLLQKRI